MCSQFLMDGTTSDREPSFFARSMAMPRLMCSGRTSEGLPSTSAYELFISGCAMTERTIAQPIRWVKLTLPPRPRARWLLITMRLSASSLAGTARTLVAVGMLSDASMLVAIFAATPRSGVVVVASAAGFGVVAAGFGAGASTFSTGLAAGLAASFGGAGAGAGALPLPFAGAFSGSGVAGL